MALIIEGCWRYYYYIMNYISIAAPSFDDIIAASLYEQVGLGDWQYQSSLTLNIDMNIGS